MQGTWYFDFVSPFAYLQLGAVRALRARLPLEPMPIAFGAVLAHHGQLGPAEIAGKREFTYRFVQWRAARLGIPLVFPPAHPFNPLAALRLCIAARDRWAAVDALFDHVWRDGLPADAASLAAVAHRLGIADVDAVVADPEIKMQLRANTDEAIARGVFGVPTLAIGSQLFWGEDATAMAQDWIDDPTRFDGEPYERLATLPIGVARAR